MKIFTSFTKSRRSTPLFVVWSFITFLVISFSAIPLHAQEDPPDPEGAAPNFVQATYGLYKTLGGQPCRMFIGDPLAEPTPTPRPDATPTPGSGPTPTPTPEIKESYVSWVGPKHLVSGTPLGRPQSPDILSSGGYQPYVSYLPRTDFTVGLTRNTRIGRSNRDPGPALEGSQPSFFQYSIEHHEYGPGETFYIVAKKDDLTGKVGGWVVFSAEKARIALGHLDMVSQGHIVRASQLYNFPGFNGLPFTYEELKYLQKARPRENFWFHWYNSEGRTRQLQTPYREVLVQPGPLQFLRVGIAPGFPNPSSQQEELWAGWNLLDITEQEVTRVKTHFHTEEICRVKSIYTPEHFTRFAGHFEGNLSSKCSESEIRAGLNDPQDARAPWCIAELIYKGDVGIKVNDAVQSAKRLLPIRGTAERVADCQDNGSARCWSMAVGSLLGDAAILAPLVRLGASGYAAFGPARFNELAKSRMHELLPEKLVRVLKAQGKYSASDIFGGASSAVNLGEDLIRGDIVSTILDLTGIPGKPPHSIVTMKTVPVPDNPGVGVRSIGAHHPVEPKPKAIGCDLPVTVAARGQKVFCETGSKVVNTGTQPLKDHWYHGLTDLDPERVEAVARSQTLNGVGGSGVYFVRGGLWNGLYHNTIVFEALPNAARPTFCLINNDTEEKGFKNL
jgi:hypothetical protein